MFSYGFQPWAALTGHQILEAIDEPNYQRLERPECCPVEIYYQIMLKCWQHLPVDRPTFAQVLNLLPEVSFWLPQRFFNFGIPHSLGILNEKTLDKKVQIRHKVVFEFSWVLWLRH